MYVHSALEDRMKYREMLTMLNRVRIFSSISDDVKGALPDGLLFDGVASEGDSEACVFGVPAHRGGERISFGDVLVEMQRRGLRWISFNELMATFWEKGRHWVIDQMTVRGEDAGKSVLRMVPLVVVGPGFAPIAREDNRLECSMPWFFLIYPATTDPGAAELILGFAYPGIGFPPDWQFLARSSGRVVS